MHFHLTIEDQYFRDRTGQEVGSLAAAHSRAISLASRLMSFCAIERRQIRAERWVVTIEEQGRSPMSVIVGPERIAEATRAGRQPRLLPQSA
jgi:hypothetical protein